MIQQSPRLANKYVSPVNYSDIFVTLGMVVLCKIQE